MSSLLNIFHCLVNITTMLPPYFWLSKATFSENEYLLAVEQDPNAIQFIPNPTNEMISKAIEGNPYIIQHIDQTDEHSLKAVTIDGMTLKFVRNKTFDICMAAIESNPYAIQYVNPNINSYVSLCKKAISINPDCSDIIATIS